MKKLFVFFSVMFFINSCVSAVDFDTSIDESIRKEYKINESEETLPKLPNVAPTQSTQIQEIKEPKVNYNKTGKTYVIKSGTKVSLVSKNAVSDRLSRGSKVSFYAKNGFTTKDGTIVPAGTIFKGTVTDSHHPQITGNGALIELKIDEIYYNGVGSKINTKVSLANYKRVFHNDIKGQRKYWQNCNKVMTPGKKFFKATNKVTTKMSRIPVLNLISFVPVVFGGVFYTVNAVAAPVISIFKKGGNISLPVGSEFEITIVGKNIING